MPWLHLADLPENKEQFGLEACQGKIYAIAGICDGDETGSCFVYDTNSGRWATMALLPRAIQSPCVRAVNGRLFCFQGYDHKTALKYPDVYLYDPNADAWRPRAPIPIPREDSGSAVINGQVWIVGGFTHPGHLIVPQIDIYDPDRNRWLAPITIKPHDEDWPGRALGDFGCTVGDHIWCMGGTEITDDYPHLVPCPWGFFTDGTDLGLVPIPDPRCYAEMEVIGDSLYVVGGCRTSTTDYADTMLILDLPTQTWKKPVLLPYPARGQGVCTWNGVLYVAGGYDGRTRTDFCLWLGDDQPTTDDNQPTTAP
jgi:N-acetylneuraminic acid mutarotase